MMLPECLGPYRILGKLGEGGMGEVYKARDTRLDRTVALKVLPPDFARDADRQARFEREAKAISQLNHPHICTLYDVGEAVPARPESRARGRASEPALSEPRERRVEGPIPFWADVSRTGTLIYAPGDVSRTALVEVDRFGRVSNLLEEGGYIVNPALSRDGSRLLFVRDGRVYVRSLSGGGATLLTADPGALAEWSTREPVWTPDERVVFASNQNGNWDIFVMDASPHSPPEGLVEMPGDQYLPAVGPDGSLLFVDSHPERAADIWISRPGRKPEVWLASSSSEAYPSFSPDGSLVAFTSDDSERYEVFVAKASDTGARERVEVSTDGGLHPAGLQYGPAKDFGSTSGAARRSCRPTSTRTDAGEGCRRKCSTAAGRSAPLEACLSGR